MPNSSTNPALIHPDLRAAIDVLEPVDIFTDVPAGRSAVGAGPPSTPVEGVLVQDQIITGPHGAPLTVRVYRSTRSAEETPQPAVLWCHGGGFVFGGLDTEDAHCRRTAQDHDAVVVSVDYRLAPENPYPAGFDDCWHALLWLVGRADELGVDPGRVATAGHSSGAALALGLAAKARDVGAPQVCYVFMGYPVLDDRAGTRSARSITDSRFFTSRDASAMWALYLGTTDVEQATYAVPARIPCLAKLPPIYMMVGALDPGRDDVLAMVDRLSTVGVSVELHLVPGAPHMFDLYGHGSALVERASRNWLHALGSALHRRGDGFGLSGSGRYNDNGQES
jgi:acetyl esterase